MAPAARMTAPAHPRVGIVVPVLNEASTLPDLLAQLQALRNSDYAVDIVVVDGGSEDGSAELVSAADLQLLCSACGRARQMNAGAAAVDGDILLFLHADTELPAHALDSVRRAVAAGAHWGRFDVRIDGRARLLRMVATLMNLRSRLSGIATGDQAMFVRRDSFERVGGFPDQPLMEDIELSRRLLRLGRPACLRLRVRTSGRRWERRGVWRTILLMWRLRWAYWRGASPDVLARAYR